MFSLVSRASHNEYRFSPPVNIQHDLSRSSGAIYWAKIAQITIMPKSPSRPAPNDVQPAQSLTARGFVNIGLSDKIAISALMITPFSQAALVGTRKQTKTHKQIDQYEDGGYHHG
jgi:hypothetical protein